MTTLFSPITNFTIPTIEAFTRICSSLNKYRAAKAQKTRVAKHIKLLKDMDAHMLNDIGMKRFNCLPNEEQVGLLLKSIRS